MVLAAKSCGRDQHSTARSDGRGGSCGDRTLFIRWTEKQGPARMRTWTGWMILAYDLDTLATFAVRTH
jgi:hypothetical protein